MTTYENTSTSLVTDNDRQWAAATHWGGLALALLTSWLVGVAGFVVPLAILMMKGKDSEFITHHAKESMNFNISMFIYAVIGVIIAFILVGATVITLGVGALLTLPSAFILLLAFFALAVMWVVCSVLGTIRAYEGLPYHYPLTIRLIK